MRRFIATGLAALLVGCLGGGPAFSSTNRDLFASPPVVVERQGRYALAWTQGSFPFYFQPEFEVVEGRLVVSVRVSSSSGMLSGRAREVAIDEPRAIAAIESGVFFWEPEPRPRGSLTRLVVRHEHP